MLTFYSADGDTQHLTILPLLLYHLGLLLLRLEPKLVFVVCGSVFKRKINKDAHCEGF